LISAPNKTKQLEILFVRPAFVVERTHVALPRPSRSERLIRLSHPKPFDSSGRWQSRWRRPTQRTARTEISIFMQILESCLEEMKIKDIAEERAGGTARHSAGKRIKGLTKGDRESGATGTFCQYKRNVQWLFFRKLNSSDGVLELAVYRNGNRGRTRLRCHIHHIQAFSIGQRENV
jgi:hypothetical protein